MGRLRWKGWGRGACKIFATKKRGSSDCIMHPRALEFGRALVCHDQESPSFLSIAGEFTTVMDSERTIGAVFFVIRIREQQFREGSEEVGISQTQYSSAPS